MQSVQGPILVSVGVGGPRVTTSQRPVSVSPPIPGQGHAIRVWTLWDTDEMACCSYELIALVTGQSTPPGFRYLATVDVQPEYGMVAHVFAREMG